MSSPLQALGAPEIAGEAVPEIPADPSSQVNWRVAPDMVIGHSACLGRTLVPVVKDTATVRDGMPIGLLHIATFRRQLRLLTDPRLPFGLLGSVHFSSSLRQTAPLAVRSPLRSDCSLCGARPHRRGTLVDMQVKVWAASDAALDTPRVTVVNTFLFFHRRRSYASPKPAATDHSSATEPATGKRTSDTLSMEVYPRHTAAWAALTGDYNPIHVSDTAAMLFGLGSKRIAHGMCVTEMLLPWLLDKALTMHESGRGADGKPRSGVRSPHARRAVQLGVVPMALLPLQLDVKFTATTPVPNRNVEAALGPAAFSWQGDLDTTQALRVVVQKAGCESMSARKRPYQELVLTWGDAATTRGDCPIY